jgi:flagellar hook protein FlgE
LGGSLESSNVDLAREFTNLIIYQRGYQANAKVITSQDQIDQVLLNIKN